MQDSFDNVAISEEYTDAFHCWFGKLKNCIPNATFHDDESMNETPEQQDLQGAIICLHIISTLVEESEYRMQRISQENKEVMDYDEFSANSILFILIRSPKYYDIIFSIINMLPVIESSVSIKLQIAVFRLLLAVHTTTETRDIYDQNKGNQRKVDKPNFISNLFVDLISNEFDVSFFLEALDYSPARVNQNNNLHHNHSSSNNINNCADDSNGNDSNKNDIILCISYISCLVGDMLNYLSVDNNHIVHNTNIIRNCVLRLINSYSVISKHWHLMDKLSESKSMRSKLYYRMIDRYNTSDGISHAKLPRPHELFPADSNNESYELNQNKLVEIGWNYNPFSFANSNSHNSSISVIGDSTLNDPHRIEFHSFVICSSFRLLSAFSEHSEILSVILEYNLLDIVHEICANASTHFNLRLYAIQWLSISLIHKKLSINLIELNCLPTIISITEESMCTFTNHNLLLLKHLSWLLYLFSTHTVPMELLVKNISLSVRIMKISILLIQRKDEDVSKSVVELINESFAHPIMMKIFDDLEGFKVFSRLISFKNIDHLDDNNQNLQVMGGSEWRKRVGRGRIASQNDNRDDNSNRLHFDSSQISLLTEDCLSAVSKYLLNNLYLAIQLTKLEVSANDAVHGHGGTEKGVININIDSRQNDNKNNNAKGIVEQNSSNNTNNPSWVKLMYSVIRVDSAMEIEVDNFILRTIANTNEQPIGMRMNLIHDLVLIDYDEYKLVYYDENRVYSQNNTNNYNRMRSSNLSSDSVVWKPVQVLLDYPFIPTILHIIGNNSNSNFYHNLSSISFGILVVACYEPKAIAEISYTLLRNNKYNDYNDNDDASVRDDAADNNHNYQEGERDDLMSIKSEVPNNGLEILLRIVNWKLARVPHVGTIALRLISSLITPPQYRFRLLSSPSTDDRFMKQSFITSSDYKPDHGNNRTFHNNNTHNYNYNYNRSSTSPFPTSHSEMQSYSSRLEAVQSRIRKTVRAYNGINTIIQLLHYKKDESFVDLIQIETIKILLGLAQDAQINSILAKMRISNIILSKIKRDDSSSTQKTTSDFYPNYKHMKELLISYGNQLMKLLTSSVNQTLDEDGDIDLTQNKLEREAIVERTHISFDQRELMIIIRDHLNAYGMEKAAAVLEIEANLSYNNLNANKPIAIVVDDDSRDSLVTTLQTPQLVNYDVMSSSIANNDDDKNQLFVPQYAPPGLIPSTFDTRISFEVKKDEHEEESNKTSHGEFEIVLARKRSIDMMYDQNHSLNYTPNHGSRLKSIKVDNESLAYGLPKPLLFVPKSIRLKRIANALNNKLNYFLPHHNEVHIHDIDNNSESLLHAHVLDPVINNHSQTVANLSINNKMSYSKEPTGNSASSSSNKRVTYHDISNNGHNGDKADNDDSEWPASDSSPHHHPNQPSHPPHTPYSILKQSVSSGNNKNKSINQRVSNRREDYASVTKNNNNKDATLTPVTSQSHRTSATHNPSHSHSQSTPSHSKSNKLHHYYPTKLNNIIHNYFKMQHQQCLHPISTLPKMSLVNPTHNCSSLLSDNRIEQTKSMSITVRNSWNNRSDCNNISSMLVNKANFRGSHFTSWNHRNPIRQSFNRYIHKQFRQWRLIRGEPIVEYGTVSTSCFARHDSTKLWVNLAMENTIHSFHDEAENVLSYYDLIRNESMNEIIFDPQAMNKRYIYTIMTSREHSNMIITTAYQGFPNVFKLGGAGAECYIHLWRVPQNFMRKRNDYNIDPAPDMEVLHPCYKLNGTDLRKPSFSPSNQNIACLSFDSQSLSFPVNIYDTETGALINSLNNQNNSLSDFRNNFMMHRATLPFNYLNPSICYPDYEVDNSCSSSLSNAADNIILSDGVLYDLRVNKPINKFDILSTYGSSCFHPKKKEIIIDSAVWDLRTFNLLQTIPLLHQTCVKFDSYNDIMYAYRPVLTLNDNPDEYRKDHKKFSSFHVLDSISYDHIYDQSVEKDGYILADLHCDSH
eukprot:gene11036-14818_t